MRKILPLVLFAVCLPTAHAQDADPEAAAAFDDDRPNIVFFLADDQRHDFLGCTGHPVVQTPRIDRLAAGGVLFENAFVTTSICAASRATLLTGLHESAHRFTFGTPPIASVHSSESYPALLKKAGYHTGFVGKFGVRLRPGEREKMFDVFAPLGRNPYHKKQPGGGTRHVTEITGDKAVEFLRGAKGEAAPFCLSVSFNAAHAEDGDKENHFPYPEAVADLYEGVEMPPPRHPEPAAFESQPEFLKRSMNRDRFFWRWDTPEKYQRNMRNYLRMISGIDRAVGRVLDELEKLALADNTVVISMADNGYYAGSRGFAGKWSHYEESLRVPLIISDPRPGGARGRREKAVALNVDIAPTILALADERVPGGYGGAELGRLLRGGAAPAPRADFFCEHRMDHRSIPKWEGVRGPRYKYARYYEQDPPFEFLHDLESDPDEMRNLAPDPAHRDALEAMRKRCAELAATYRSQAEADARRALRRAQFGMLDAGHGDMAAAVDEALALDPGSAEARLARADMHEKAGRFGEALGDLDALVAANPEIDELLQRRGVTRFFQGDMAGAIADFDAYLERNPGREPHHWQRGLAYYYAGEFEKGAAQFEIHQEVNSNDVENAVWHFLCVTKLEGLEAAKRKLIPIEGDPRVPMTEVHGLFAGEVEPEAVLAAARAGGPDADELRDRLCYAHLYLGLYFEAAGDAEKSLEHIRLSAEEHAMPHYMGEVARVHLRLRRR